MAVPARALSWSAGKFAKHRPPEVESRLTKGATRQNLRTLTAAGPARSARSTSARQGKGKMDRVIPIGESALYWIQRYVAEVRPRLLRRKVRHQIFLSRTGNALTPSGASILVREYLTRAGITGRGACHMFRHSMATAMLENGANIRFIQEMLGHADLKTTQIYTHVNPMQLKQIHAATHPARMAG